jgi:hypothetical protein
MEDEHGPEKAGALMKVLIQYCNNWLFFQKLKERS